MNKECSTPTSERRTKLSKSSEKIGNLIKARMIEIDQIAGGGESKLKTNIWIFRKQCRQKTPQPKFVLLVSRPALPHASMIRIDAGPDRDVVLFYAGQ
jgi:hypothetical protein